MKTSLKILCLLCLAMFLCLPLARAQAAPVQQPQPSGKLVLGGAYTLMDGETLNGDLFVLGGDVNLMSGSTVNGNVVIAGGSMRANGAITGSLISFGGSVQMSASTTVGGDVSAIGGSLTGQNLAAIQGQTTTNASPNLPLVIPGGPKIEIPNINVHFNPVYDFLWLLVQSFIWAALAVLVSLFAARPIQRVGNTVVSQALVAGGLGFLTAIVGSVVLVVIAITIICIPLSLFGFLALGVAWAFGIIAIGTETGERLGKMGKADWGLPVSAALGTFLVTLIINSVGKVVPCVGWLLPFLVGVVGLGAVLLTRFGTHNYPDDAAPVVVPPAPLKDNDLV